MRHEGLAAFAKATTWNVEYEWQLPLIEANYLHEHVAQTRGLILHHAVFGPFVHGFTGIDQLFLFPLVNFLDTMKKFSNLRSLDIQLHHLLKKTKPLQEVFERVLQDSDSIQSITFTQNECKMGNRGCDECVWDCECVWCSPRTQGLQCRWGMTRWGIHDPVTCPTCQASAIRRERHDDDFKTWVVELNAQLAG